MNREQEITKRDSWYAKQMGILRSDPRPYMDKEDIALFHIELSKVFEAKSESFDVLEWGAGGSTIYMSSYFTIFGQKFTIESLEHDIVWYTELCKMNLPNVRLHLFDEDVQRYDDSRALKGKPMTEYVKFPSRLGKKYDFIFIDGVNYKRVECMREAVSLLKEDGVVIVHDADRPEYKEGFDLFKGKFLSKKLWKGSM